jgi:hypothetical protein
MIVMVLFRILSVLLPILVSVYSWFYIRRILKFLHLYRGNIFLIVMHVVLAVLIGWLCRNMRQTSTMAFLHVVVIAFACDLAAGGVRLLLRGRSYGQVLTYGNYLCRSGLIPLLLVAVIFLYGAVNMSSFRRTEYQLATDKLQNDYRIILITDTHYGTIQDTAFLAQAVEEINSLQPDLVVLCGDIVEEGTTKARMQEVFQVFAGLSSRYGTYYVYGNHDRQPYTSQPFYTEEELAQAIQSNGITILEDDYTEIGDDLILAGRADAAWGNSSGRASTETILKDADMDKYVIVADHQPIEAEDNDAQGVDLQISGHTHAGQIWPVGIFTELSGGYNYGLYQSGNCSVIVSSGFTGWGYPVRTEEHCEYVDIQLQAVR